jgi:hypothetical protein
MLFNLITTDGKNWINSQMAQNADSMAPAQLVHHITGNGLSPDKAAQIVANEAPEFKNNPSHRINFAQYGL